MRARTDRPWLPTTTVGRSLPRCSSTAAHGASSAGARRPTTCCRLKPTTDDDQRPTTDDQRPMTNSGVLIAFEGLDQSGKQTQAERLRDLLKLEGRKSRLVSFPDYGTSIGEEIARGLPGVRESYQRQAAGGRWVVVDGEQSKDNIAEEVFTVVRSRLALP